MFNAQFIKDLHFIQQNERKLKAHRTKEDNKAKELYIQNDIMKFYRTGIPLLDRMPDNGGSKQQQPKDLNTILSFNDFNVKSTSAITMTFNSSLRDNYSELELRHILMNNIKIIAGNKDMDISMILIPDADEGGNFHYHGCIKLPLKYRPTFKRLITQQIGFMKFSYIKDFEGWTKYCFKPDVYSNEDINALKIII